ncbi:hypothetical protein HDR60_04530 [bacterium]|nr:hypothetical protein [bacterium]
MNKTFMIFGVFAILSGSVSAEDLTKTEFYKCMKKESLSVRKIVFKECGIPENLVNSDDLIGKITDAQKKCMEGNLQKNQEKYKSTINEIIEKCKDVK